MPSRFFAFALVGMLIATPAMAQDPSPTPSHRYTVRVRPKIHLQHIRPLAGEMRFRMKHARPELRMRNQIRLRMRPFHMRDFRFRMRPRLRLQAGTAEI